MVWIKNNLQLIFFVQFFCSQRFECNFDLCDRKVNVIYDMFLLQTSLRFCSPRNALRVHKKPVRSCICLFIRLPVCSSFCKSVLSAVQLFVCLSVHPSFHPSVRSIYARFYKTYTCIIGLCQQCVGRCRKSWPIKKKWCRVFCAALVASTLIMFYINTS